jgi:hypothetical protein
MDRKGYWLQYYAVWFGVYAALAFVGIFLPEGMWLKEMLVGVICGSAVVNCIYALRHSKEK